MRCFVLNLFPEHFEVTHIGAELFLCRPLFSGRPDNVPALFFLRLQAAHFVTKFFPKVRILNTLGNADMGFAGNINELPAGKRHCGREPRSLRSDRILCHLHHHGLPLMQHALDRESLISLMRFCDVGDMKERCPLESDVDKGGLHARQHPGHASQIHVSHKPAGHLPLQMDFLQDAVHQNRHAGFPGRIVDQDLFHDDFLCCCRTAFGVAPMSPGAEPRPLEEIRPALKLVDSL